MIRSAMKFQQQQVGLLIVSCLFAILSGNAQTSLYDSATLQKIELHFSQSDWDYELDTSRSGADGYVMADWVRINGTQFDSVGVKYKGNSSYDATYVKNPIHIELDALIDQSYNGVVDVKLSNGYGDPSLVREVLAYSILRNYMEAPKCNFAQLYINDQYIGVYSNTESITKQFCATHFYSSGNAFFKCNPTVIPGPTTKSNLRYLTADSTDYATYYELKSDAGWSDLLAACNTITNSPTNVADVIDVDRAIWMLAFNNVLVNLDSYSGVFAQNYYLYRDNTGLFNPVVWDLNMSFGGFPYVGSGNSSLGSLTVANMQQLPTTIHATDTYWPLIKAIQGNALYKRMYVAHVRTIVSEYFASNDYLAEAAALQSLIDTAAASDTNAFFPYSDFQSSMTTDYPFGSYTVPGISNLMSARMTYLEGTAEFQYTQPTIGTAVSSVASPPINSTFTLTVEVTNTVSSGVYVGYRDAYDQHFTRISMLDDGAHNDGASGDNVFGADLTMSAPYLQYYIYAENSNAGIFSPQRAEHEYYSIASTVQVPEAGDVAINEFLATNANDEENEYADRTDWIELYNTSDAAVSLYGLFLSDDYELPMKYAFPEDATIPAHGYLAVWADQQETSVYLHANFKLSGSGERIMLSDYHGNMLDSITFGQQTEDISMGRCPDGTGSFGFLEHTSFLSSNCIAGIDQLSAHYSRIFPNPTTGMVTISRSGPLQADAAVQLYNGMGQCIRLVRVTEQSSQLDFSGVAPGIYLLKVGDEPVQQLIIH